MKVLDLPRLATIQRRAALQRRQQAHVRPPESQFHHRQGLLGPSRVSQFHLLPDVLQAAAQRLARVLVDTAVVHLVLAAAHAPAEHQVAAQEAAEHQVAEVAQEAEAAQVAEAAPAEALDVARQSARVVVVATAKNFSQ